MLVQNDTWLPRLDSRSPLPLYEQIVEAVALAIAAGELVPGDPLPSVRHLAAELRINPNTAARSCQKLEALGLGASRRGRGSVVADDAREPAARLARRAVEREVDNVVRVGTSLGVDLDEIVESVRARWQETKDAD